MRLCRCLTAFAIAVQASPQTPVAAQENAPSMRSEQDRPARPHHVTAPDGVRIAYEVFGDGRPIIFIGGILSDRASLREVARDVATEAATVTFDRRGRGDSGDAGAYSVAREVGDIHALAVLFDEPPILFGHSSGAGLAIEAAASGMPLAGVILYEPPYGADDEDSRAESRAFAEMINARLEAGDRPGAILSFFEALGLPPEEARGMAEDPAMQTRAGTMAYDFAVMGHMERGGVIPLDKIGAIRLPALVLTGELSPPFFSEIAREVADALPGASLQTVPGADHAAHSDSLPGIIRTFATSVPQVPK